MEQETGCPSGASSYISLNENEQRYYSGLHSLCQTDAGSGKLSAAKVAELLKASQLPPESLHQVTEVCGARRSGFFGSAQFLVALKLVAAAQTGLPISLESTPKDLPLPRFPGLQSDQDPRFAVGPQGLGPQQVPRFAVGPQGLGPQQAPRFAVGPQGLGPQQDPRYGGGAQGLGPQQAPRCAVGPQGLGPQQDPRYDAGPQGLGPQQDPRFAVGPQGLGPQQDPRFAVGPQGLGASVPWTPADRSNARLAESSTELEEYWSPTPSPLSSPPHSPPLLRHYPVTMATPGAIPHTANERQDHHSSPKYRTKPPELSAVHRASVDQQQVCSEEGDPWRITGEQQEYYTNQFKSLQPDLGALILGTVAKNFFTKSKLPIPELSHIWELSDVDRDGALTFSEFCTAFHLIVARKNGCSLPETLPPSLQPSLPLSLSSSLPPSLPSSLPPSLPSVLHSSLPPSLPSSLSLALPPCLPSSLPPSLPLSLQTGFVDQDLDSPDTPGSAEPLIVFEDVSSQPMDRSGLDRLKPSLLKQEMTSESDSRSRTWRRAQDQHSLPARPEPLILLDPHMKTRSRPRSYSSTSIDEAMKKAEEPPTPPPRPQKTHSRASSLDLNKLLQQGAPGVRGGWLPPPPALPPRPLATQAPLFLPPSEKTPVKKPLQTNFTRFREEEENQEVHRDGPLVEDLSPAPTQDLIGPSHLRVPQKPVRRKFHPDNPEAPPPSTTALAPPTKPLQKLQSKQKREIQTTIRKNKESNAVLTRLNSELQQQLKEVHQQRTTLESQLDLLRPLTSGPN